MQQLRSSVISFNIRERGYREGRRCSGTDSRNVAVNALGQVHRILYLHTHVHTYVRCSSSSSTAHDSLQQLQDENFSESRLYNTYLLASFFFISAAVAARPWLDIYIREKHLLNRSRIFMRACASWPPGKRMFLRCVYIHTRTGMLIVLRAGCN